MRTKTSMTWIGVMVAAVMTIPMLAFAEGTNYGAMSDFEQGVGGRASGMGGAYVAAADDVSSAYWNPAGLSGMELYTYELEVQHAFLPNQTSFNYAGYAFQIPGMGNYAITWMNFSAGDFESRDLQGNPNGSYSNAENVLIFSYGRKVYSWLKGLSVGANLKFLSYTLGEASALGPGLDIGAQWQPILWWDHTLGFNVQNLFQRVYWASGPVDPSQVNVKIGAALRFLRSEDDLYYNHLVSTIDAEIAENQQYNFRAGIEYWYLKELGIRAGYSGKDFTLGASYTADLYEVDYSYHYDLSGLSTNQHLVALMIRLK